MVSVHPSLGATPRSAAASPPPSPAAWSTSTSASLLREAYVSFGISYLNQGLPFGGRKHSGYGRFGGPEGLLGITAPKAITEDVFFGIVQTSIPAVVDYPLDNTQRSWACTCAGPATLTQSSNRSCALPLGHSQRAWRASGASCALHMVDLRVP